MGLETATFISSLTPSWPTSGESKGQGDDHIRLIKSALQATFPIADKPFYFPKVEEISSTITLDATDQNNIVMVDTTAGSVAVTLPSSLTVADKGWRCEIIKTSNDQNAAIVSPAAGTISSKVGSTATIRVGILNEPATFLWTGTAWKCWKFGPMIGSTENFDGAATPPGYIEATGATYVSADFAELFAVLATSTLKDKRGRVEAGVDGSAVNLSATHFGTTPSLGAVKAGAGAQTLVTGNLPAYTPSGTVSSALSGAEALPGGVYGLSAAAGGASFLANTNTGAAAPNLPVTGTVTSAFTGAAQGGTSAAFSIIQPTIIVKKIIRAC